MPRISKGSAPSEQRRLKITLVKSPIGFNRDQARVVTGMGLRRIRHSVDAAGHAGDARHDPQGASPGHRWNER